MAPHPLLQGDISIRPSFCCHFYLVPVLHADITCDIIIGGKERLFLPSFSADWQVTPNVLGGFCMTTGMGIIFPKYSTTCVF